jgi:uncharacterized protein (TIGR02246 family)
VTIGLGVLLVAAIGWAPSAVGQRPDSAEDAAIKAVVARYAEAREEQAARKIQPLFTADADQLVSSGEWRRGRDALVEGMLASTARSGGTRTLVVETVRMLSPEVALADARYEIAQPGASIRKMWSTFVLVKTPEGWRITAIRNMLPAPQAR